MPINFVYQWAFARHTAGPPALSAVAHHPNEKAGHKRRPGLASYMNPPAVSLS
ncbi:hypothetical protein GobsT_72300 [Gemmata obscuriglobus]|nr:hypothetical protein GobsT_72300 [Gemmata obscuriglobus]VTS11731.1 unnamed protein product [Gemmata obscuriglobus UQM 2246]